MRKRKYRNDLLSSIAWPHNIPALDFIRNAPPQRASHSNRSAIEMQRWKKKTSSNEKLNFRSPHASTSDPIWWEKSNLTHDDHFFFATQHTRVCVPLPVLMRRDWKKKLVQSETEKSIVRIRFECILAHQPNEPKQTEKATWKKGEQNTARWIKIWMEKEIWSKSNSYFFLFQPPLARSLSCARARRSQSHIRVGSLRPPTTEKLNQWVANRVNYQ